MPGSLHDARRPGRALLIGLGLLTACSAPSDPALNLVIIVVDALRADALGLYGNPLGTSPALDAFGGQAVVFDRAWAQGTYTPASYMSYMTSTHVRTHGWDYAEFHYPKHGVCGWDDLSTLPEVLARHEFSRTAFVANSYLHPKRGFPRGFERWNGLDVPALRQRSELDRNDYALDDAAIVRKAAEALAAWTPEGRHFLYLHLMAPHLPLEPTAEARRHFGLGPDWAPEGGITIPLIKRWGREPTPEQRDLSRRAYHACVWDGDRHVGSILSAIEGSGHREDTVVVVMSDHGEQLWEHDDYGHRYGVWDALVRVPLLIRAPGIGAGRVVDRVVGLLDVAPTVLELLGIRERPSSWQGEALFGSSRPRGVVSQRFGEVAVTIGGRTKGVVQSRGFASGWRFFDLSADPDEQRPHPVHPEGEALEMLLAEWSARTPAATRDPDATPVGICSVLSPREREQHRDRLRTLGYAE